MYSVNNKSQETTDKFYVMRSRRDHGWIKIIQPKRVANQKIRTKNKQEHARRLKGVPKGSDCFSRFTLFWRQLNQSLHFLSILCQFPRLLIAQKDFPPRARIARDLSWQLGAGHFPATNDTYGLTDESLKNPIRLPLCIKRPHFRSVRAKNLQKKN